MLCTFELELSGYIYIYRDLYSYICISSMYISLWIDIKLYLYSYMCVYIYIYVHKMMMIRRVCRARRISAQSAPLLRPPAPCCCSSRCRRHRKGQP